MLNNVLCRVLLIAFLSACGGDGKDNDDGLADLTVDTGIPWRGNPDQLDYDGPAAPVDSAGDDLAGTLDAVVGIDLVDDNAPPSFAALNPLELKMGSSTTLDLTPFISDVEDDAGTLQLSWSAQHVAMKDPGDHNLYIVAPVNWNGTEPIVITVTDSGGLEATSTLKVMVTKVDVPEPIPADCSEIIFSNEAGTDAQEVLLSGSFNNWGGDAQSAAVMSDPDADGIFEATLFLDPGKYFYKFIVDGEWLTDPLNPDQAEDGYGGFNSVLEVPSCD
jgi:hypothetical protein